MFVIVRFWLPLAVVAIYATWRGGAPERIGAALLVTAAALSEIVRPHGPDRFVSVRTGVLLVDLALMAGLVWLAIRANRQWPAVLAALHGLTLLGHLGRAENADLWELGYYLMATVPVLPGLAVLAVGTWSHHRRTRRLGTDPSWKR